MVASSGEWEPEPAKVRYRWFADGARIEYATRQAFAATPEVEGKQLTVRVTATGEDGESATATSEPTEIVQPSSWQEIPFPKVQYPGPVACPSSNECFTIAWAKQSDTGKLLRFDGASWSVARDLGEWYGDAIDCAGDGSCMMILRTTGRNAAPRYATYSQGKWSRLRSMPRPPTRRDGHRWSGSYNGVSCASRSFCTAHLGGSYADRYGGSGGFMLTYDANRAPKDPKDLADVRDLGTLLRLGESSNRWKPWSGKWSLPRRVTSTNHLFEYSCPSRDFCAVYDVGAPSVATFSNMRTRREVRLGRKWDAGTSVHCPQTTYCFAAASNSYRIWNGRKWSPEKQSPVAAWSATCVPGVEHCMGVGTMHLGRDGTPHPRDRQGTRRHLGFMSLLGDTWGEPEVVSFDDEMTYLDNSPWSDRRIHLACPSESQCVLNAAGRSFVYGSAD